MLASGRPRNRTKYGYDARGNTLSYSTVSATYNDAGRASTISHDGVTEVLIYNALGQRIQRSGGSAGTILYAYDEAGHVLGEYDDSGGLIEETVWLGDIPVATLRPNGGGVDIFYVHTDQLNTPRAVTRPADNVLMWSWFSDPFGTDAANENPAGAGTFRYSLRFAGQVFDGQAGLHDNGFRAYDPAIGRYVESDPIGLYGGSWSTYSYANNNPISNDDPDGKQVALPAPVVAGGIAAICAAIPSCRDAAINAAKVIRNACAVPHEQEEDKNCEALYQSTLQTCASLTGRKRFACFEAARENREQCYQEKGKKPPPR